MNETWKPAIYIRNDGRVLDGSKCVEVSNLGNVRFAECYNNRVKRPTVHKKFTKTRWGNSSPNYLHLTMTYEDEQGNVGRSAMPLHRVILCSFNPDGWDAKLQCDHIDRNIYNNALDNLRWVTQEQNQANRGKK